MQECSREVSIETIGWVMYDNNIHHISNVQANHMLPCAGELQGFGAIFKEYCHRAAAIHLLLPAQDSKQNKSVMA